MPIADRLILLAYAGAFCNNPSAFVNSAFLARLIKSSRANDLIISFCGLDRPGVKTGWRCADKRSNTAIYLAKYRGLLTQVSNVMCLTCLAPPARLIQFYRLSLHNLKTVKREICCYLLSNTSDACKAR